MTPRLVFPSKRYKAQYLREIKSLPDGDIPGLTSKEKRELALSDFDLYLSEIRNERMGRNLKKGRVPATVYWLADGKKFLGQTSMRHKLNKNLRRHGGHIGYWIVPKQRGKGYGKLILKLALQKAKRLGIKHVLISCDVKNTPSRRIIESNGGKLEGKFKVPEKKTPILRFWINNL